MRNVLTKKRESVSGETQPTDRSSNTAIEQLYPSRRQLQDADDEKREISSLADYY